MNLQVVGLTDPGASELQMPTESSQEPGTCILPTQQKNGNGCKVAGHVDNLV